MATTPGPIDDPGQTDNPGSTGDPDPIDTPGTRPNPNGCPENLDDYIRHLQCDGRLLLRFIARRVDRALQPKDSADAKPAQPVAGKYQMLFAPAKGIAGAPCQLTALVTCVDELSRRAAPASVRSIRFTADYMGIDIEGDKCLDGTKTWWARVRHWWGTRPCGWWRTCGVRRSLWGIVFIVLLLLPLSVGLLAQVDYGRRLLQQLATMREQENDIQRDILALPLKDTRLRSIEIPRRVGMPGVVASVLNSALTGLSGIEGGTQPCAVPHYINAAGKTVAVSDLQALSRDSVAEEQRHLVVWREPVTPVAIALCRRYDDNRVRLAVVYTGLADWNCMSHDIVRFNWLPRWLAQWLFPDANLDRPAPWRIGHLFAGWLGLGAPPNCGGPTVGFPPEIDQTTWQSHEIWVKATTAVFAGFVLPLLLGCLGGCAYALRRINRKISRWTLQPNDGRHAVSRVVLAALMGGLIGVVFSPDNGVTLGGFTLSLAAAAFFVGFAVEGVFKLIETLIANVIRSFASPPATTRPAP